MPQHWDCIVIGAGFAGAAAAIHLADAGKRVLQLESRPYIGGRVRSFVDTVSGEEIDNGQHLLMGAYHSSLPLLHKLGTADLVRAQKRMQVAFVDLDRNLHVLDSAGWPGALGMARGMIGLGGVTLGDKMRALQFALRLRLGANFDGYATVRDLLLGERQGRQFITRFWEPMVLATMNASLDEAAPEPFLNVLRQAFLGSSNDMKLLFPTAGLSQLLEPLANYLENRNGQLQHGDAVDELLIKDGKACGVRLKSGEMVHARHIISAVPARALERFLPSDADAQNGAAAGADHPADQGGSVLARSNSADKASAVTSMPQLHQAIKQIEYSPIVSVYLWFDRDFVDHDFVATLGTQIQWVFNKRRLTGSTAQVERKFPGHLTVTVSAADDLNTQSAEEVVDVCLRELAAMFPGGAQAKLLHSKVIKEKMATFRLSREYNAIRPVSRTTIQGFWLAGDWTATGLPATIEGAALSGERAAKAVLADFVA